MTAKPVLRHPADFGRARTKGWVAAAGQSSADLTARTGKGAGIAGAQLQTPAGQRCPALA